MKDMKNVTRASVAIGVVAIMYIFVLPRAIQMYHRSNHDNIGIQKICLPGQISC